MNPGGAPNTSPTSSAVAGRAGRPRALASLISFRRWSPRTTTSSGSESSPTSTGKRLDQRAGRHVERGADLLDGLGPGRVHALGRLERPGQALDRLGRGGGDLHVGGVPGVGERDVVLAGRAGRHVLVGPDAAHRPHVGLHPVPLEAGAVEDPVVGAGLEVVGGAQALLVAVEGVGVLHDELARAQDPGARPRLVPLLGLDVVRHQRQVAVGADGPGHVEGDGLLVGHGQHHLRAAPVLELEQLVDPVAAALLPQLRRGDHRHQHLQAADGVHLLADDLLGLAVRSQARRASTSTCPPRAGGSAPRGPSACARRPRRRPGPPSRSAAGSGSAGSWPPESRAGTTRDGFSTPSSVPMGQRCP